MEGMHLMDYEKVRRILEYWIREGKLGVVYDDEQPNNPKKQRLLVFGMNATYFINVEGGDLPDETRLARDANVDGDLASSS